MAVACPFSQQQGHATISGHGLGGGGHGWQSPSVNPTTFRGQRKAGRDEPAMAPAVVALPLHSESESGTACGAWR